MLGRVARRLRAEGPAGLWYAIADRVEDWRDARFDRRFGIDTRFETGHQPIQIGVFRRIVHELPRSPRSLAFADYGCGKGRALILAAELGFAHVAGVEHVPSLHSRALANVRSYREMRPGAPSIEVTLGDASAWDPPERPAMLFLYTPFDEAVFRQVVQRLHERWQARQPQWLIAYRTPVHARILQDAGWVQPVVERPDFRIWRTNA